MSLLETPYGATSVVASSSEDNLVLTPTTDRRLRLFYVCLNADGGNGADVTAIVKFGTGGGSLYTVDLKAGAIWARNIGAGKRHLQGALNESLYVNLDGAQTVNVSVEYEEYV